MIDKMQTHLIDWYRQNKRTLPWRTSRDAYRIWISEVMLQQTTVAAVVPYYERFIKRFPDVRTLAEAPLEDVYEMWAGLGYYSRARNLHKAAQELHQNGFPKTAKELIKLPGFGPYTSHAVASLAFNEAVGVLDGNVIRVLSRVYGLKLNWWQPQARAELQRRANELAQTKHNSDLNQGLMELGATVCTPKKPLCLLCPWKKFCVALKNNQVDKLPLPKPKPEFQTWSWQMQVKSTETHIYLEPNKVAPFLSDVLFPPGEAKQLQKKPAKFDLKHGVTKYDIYIQLQHKRVKRPEHAAGTPYETSKKPTRPV